MHLDMCNHVAYANRLPLYPCKRPWVNIKSQTLINFADSSVHSGRKALLASLPPPKGWIIYLSTTITKYFVVFLSVVVNIQDSVEWR